MAAIATYSIWNFLSQMVQVDNYDIVYISAIIVHVTVTLYYASYTFNINNCHVTAAASWDLYHHSLQSSQSKAAGSLLTKRSISVLGC